MDYIQTYIECIISGCNKLSNTVSEPQTPLYIESDQYKKRIETYLYNDPEMELWFQRQCRMW